MKFHLAFRDTVDPFAFVVAGFNSGVAQWKDAFPAYGLGTSGYGKRFGAAYGDQAIGNYLTEAILPTLLRQQDPRYFRRGQLAGNGGALGTLLRATVVYSHRCGRRGTFNASEIFGNAVGGGDYPASYYPAFGTHGGEKSVSGYGVQLMSDTAAFNVLLEFPPDMRHRIFRK